MNGGWKIFSTYGWRGVFNLIFHYGMISSPVAFDEDFEAELAENHDVRREVSLLAKSPDCELTEVR